MITKHPNARVILLTISLGLLSFGTGVTLWRVYQAQKLNSLETLILLPEARVIADFSLVDNSGKAFSQNGFKGHWSLIFFGFTSCPDVCPNTLFQLQQARRLMLEQESAATLPQIYFITVDPERDTPQKLSDYLGYFDPAFIGLSGEEQQLQALGFQLGIAFFITSHETGNAEYNVDHSAALLLIDPSGKLHAVLPAPHEATSIAHDVLTVMRVKGH